MSNDNTANIKLFIKSLSQAISSYSSSLTPIQNKSLNDLINSIPDNDDSDSNLIKDQLTILNNYAYVIISTLFAYLKSIGVDTDSHPIKKELSRIKESMARLKNFNPDNLEQDEQTKKLEEDIKKKDYLNKIIGVKGNGIGNGSPAISKESFIGTHKRFNDDIEIENSPDVLSNESDVKGGISRQDKKSIKKKSIKTKPKTDKVSKPKTGKVSKLKKVKKAN